MILLSSDGHRETVLCRRREQVQEAPNTKCPTRNARVPSNTQPRLLCPMCVDAGPPTDRCFPRVGVFSRRCEHDTKVEDFLDKRHGLKHDDGVDPSSMVIVGESGLTSSGTAFANKVCHTQEGRQIHPDRARVAFEVIIVNEAFVVEIAGLF